MNAMSDESVISSARNPLIKRVRTLVRHDEDSETIAIEGLRAIIAAIDAAVTIQMILVAPERLHSERAQVAIEEARQRGAQIQLVTAAVLDDLSARDASQGMIALAARPHANWSALPSQGAPFLVALYEPQDPGNVGTIARTADGAGTAGMVILGTQGVDPFHPRAVRASMGALFTLPVITADDPLAAFAHLHTRGYHVVGAAGGGALDLWQVPLGQATTIVLGNERTGLPEALLAQCDAVARIPLAGQADSLNVAAAAAIFLYEAVRQRQG